MISPGKNIHINIAAYHEAGHALAALKEGRRVSFIFAFHCRPGGGVCFHASKPSNPHDIAFNSGTAKAAWEHTLETTCAAIRIALAGPLAEAKALGKPLRSMGASSDLVKCMYEVERLNMLRSYIARYTEHEPVITTDILNRERRKVRHWIAHPNIWNMIVEIAERLSLHGGLTGKYIDALIGSATSPERQTTLDFSGRVIHKKPTIIPRSPGVHKLPRAWTNNQHRASLYWPFLADHSNDK